MAVEIHAPVAPGLHLKRHIVHRGSAHASRRVAFSQWHVLEMGHEVDTRKAAPN